MKSKTQIIFLVFLVLAAVTVFLPEGAQARGLVPCGGYADNAGTIREPACNVVHVFALIARLTNFLIGFAGVYAVFQIVNGGFWLAVSMGNEESITKGKKTVSHAVVGLALAMLAYVFMNTVVNVLLVMNEKGKKVNFQNPWCYVLPDETRCTR